MIGAAATATPAAAPRLGGERLNLAILWVMMVGGAFVFAEPSPYELGALAAIATFALNRSILLRAAHLPLILVILVYCLGLTIAALPVLFKNKVLVWVVVSWYMAATTIFFAAIFSRNAEARLDVIVRAWTLAAIIASLAGIAGYFRAFPGAFDLFTLYGRAKGTFNDPNVFGPFLIFPLLILVQRMLLGNGREVAKAGPIVALLMIGLLLSFSRGAWIHFAASAGLMIALLFVTCGSPGERARIILMCLAGLLAIGAFLGALLSIEKVAELMKERASLSQSYDMGPMGRFGRHALGWEMALDRPLGIGPLQFSTFFPEAPHNVYLNSFMAGGWLSGLSYIVLVAIIAIVGLVACFRRAPWQRVVIALYATFIGLVIEGKIIDTDHWRHFWALAGLIWGLAMATRFNAARPA